MSRYSIESHSAAATLQRPPSARENDSEMNTVAPALHEWSKPDVDVDTTVSQSSTSPLLPPCRRRVRRSEQGEDGFSPPPAPSSPPKRRAVGKKGEQGRALPVTSLLERGWSQ